MGDSTRAVFKLSADLSDGETLETLIGNSSVYNYNMGTVTYTYGTGDGKVNFIMIKTGTLAAATPVDFDMDAGTLTDILGNTFTAAKIKGIHVKNTHASQLMQLKGNFLLLTGTGYIPVTGGGEHLLHFPSGRDVVAAAQDVITLESASAGTTYQIIVVGETT